MCWIQLCDSGTLSPLCVELEFRPRLSIPQTKIVQLSTHPCNRDLFATQGVTRVCGRLHGRGGSEPERGAQERDPPVLLRQKPSQLSHSA